MAWGFTGVAGSRFDPAEPDLEMPQILTEATFRRSALSARRT